MIEFIYSINWSNVGAWLFIIFILFIAMVSQDDYEPPKYNNQW